MGTVHGPIQIRFQANIFHRSSMLWLDCKVLSFKIQTPVIYARVHHCLQPLILFDREWRDRRLNFDSLSCAGDRDVEAIRYIRCPTQGFC